MRQVQADIRQWYTDAEWSNWGDTPSRASATTFKIATDVTSRYTVNRRIKMYDATTFYGTIVASSYGAPDTTVTVTTDSGSLTASLTSVALAIISPTNISVPTTIGRKGADIASATTTDLSVASGDYVDVTGTTTITGLGTVASGVHRTVRFTGALTLTHNATSLILPAGGANITTAANDTATFRSLGSGNWLCVSYSKASGLANIVSTSGQKVFQYVYTTSNSQSSTATTIPNDNTIPQNTEGAQLTTLAITPNSASNILHIRFTIGVTDASAALYFIVALFQDSTANALQVTSTYKAASGTTDVITLDHIMVAGTTSATTFKIRAGPSTGTAYFNTTAGGSKFNAVNTFTLEIWETTP
jgi:hypothetical protein